MKFFELTINDIDKYKLDIINLLKQSLENSFPEACFNTEFLLKKIELLKGYINDKKALVFAINNELSLIGFIWFFEKNNQNDNVIHINHFIVNEKYRNLGLGKLLLNEVEKYAKQQGIKEIELLVTKKNTDAVNFYKKRNFEVERFIMKKKL